MWPASCSKQESKHNLLVRQSNVDRWPSSTRKACRGGVAWHLSMISLHASNRKKRSSSSGQALPLARSAPSIAALPARSSAPA